VEYLGPQSTLYVQPFPGPDPKVTVASGALTPVWSRTSNELYFVKGATLMAVSFETKAGFRPSRPRKVLDVDFQVTSAGSLANFDVHPDIERFVVVKNSSPDSITELNVVLNWFEELKRLVPTE